jgi:hypothetical protein
MAAAGALLAMVAPGSVDASTEAAGPEVSTLATFGTGLGAGSTIGPDSALYVTDPNAGSVLRVDRQTGDVSTFADGLPTQVLGIGGAMDVAFVGSTAFVLVTMVGGDIVDGDHIGDDVVGIYRLEEDGNFMPIADLGAWSVEYPPETDYFVTTGVHYSLEPYGGGFLVTDGHHNRVLRVSLDGAIDELIAFDNIVPTGLETLGSLVVMAQAGPLPHLPEDGRIVAFGSPDTVADVAAGASLIVDVEVGGGTLYALSQGQWDEVAEGSPALPDTGRLVAADRDGQLVPVVDAAGDEIVLDRPTSLELIGDTAYVVGLSGTVVQIDNL